MKIIDRVELFVNIFKELKGFDRDQIKDLLGLKKYKSNETKLVLEEYLTLIILYRFSGQKNLKCFWYIEKYHSDNCWPNMPSYNTFVVWINRLEKILKTVLENHLSRLYQGLGMIDSTKLETSTPHWWGKTHREATRGYSSTGEYFGLKLHALINDKNQLCCYEITPAKTHDLTPIKRGLLALQNGKILADSGYVSREIYFKLMEQNITLIAKPKNIMMENNMLGLGYLKDWKNYSKLYRKRVRIERYFSYLKENLNMVLNKLHSTKALFTHVFSSLLAMQWLINGVLRFKTI